MNDEIRKIVNGYLSEGDYEKALSLILNLPLEDAADKELLEKCKKEFTASCTSSLASAVSQKDCVTAGKILQSYKKLMGEDANTELFQTLINGMSAASQPTESAKEKSSFNFTEFALSCVPGEAFVKSKILWITYLILAVITVACTLICDPADLPEVLLCVVPVVLSIALALPVLSCKNNLFKALGLILLLLPVISTISLYSVGLSHIRGVDTKLAFPSLPWLFSSVWVIIFCFLNAKSSLKFKIISSLLLFSILDPVWYGMIVPCGVEEYYQDIRWHRFYPEAGLMICLSTLASLCFYYFSIRGFARDTIKRIWQKILANKKKIVIAVGIVMAIVVIVFIVGSVQESHRREVARQAVIEQARQDSIQAVERARIAAIEKARQDSIAAVQRREQAHRDSIDYAEHAGFVKKYANVGLIITKLKMTRGTNSNGVATKGIEYTIFNPTHKTIKYVIANIQAVNKFNDRISYEQRCRGMGPIDSHDYGTWDFNDVFDDKNDVIDDLLVSFQVVYTNGSSKTIRWKDAYVSDFKSSWFNGR
ncbi:MAG: hypothetical protein K2M68_04305 [Muribaculaceae bacterium]|nr:hypothetical protein [Muribaculaceae bacterium]